MKRLVALALALALAASSAGAPSRKASPLVVEGDTVVIVKSLPCKVVAPAGADFYQWSHPDAVKASASDNVLTITSAPKGAHKVAVVMLTIEIDFEKKTKRVVRESAEAEVNVGESPTPPKPPTPRPLPDGELGLIKASRDGARLVDSPDKDAEAARLAEAQRTHAAAVAAGAFPDAAKILDGWRAANRKALSAEQQKLWFSWGSGVSTKLGELHKAGKLPGNNDWAAAFSEIADGLAPSGKEK